MVDRYDASRRGGEGSSRRGTPRRDAYADGRGDARRSTRRSGERRRPSDRERSSLREGSSVRAGSSRRTGERSRTRSQGRSGVRRDVRGDAAAQRSGRRNSKTLTTRNPSDARARAIRKKREAARRQRNARLALVGVLGLLCLLLVFFALRAMVGCVSGVFRGSSEQQAEQQESAETAAQAEKGQEVQIDLVMIGDILQHMGVFESGYQADGTRNYDHVFAHIGSEIEGADIKVVNQETVLGGEQFEFSGYPTFNGPQEMGDAEVKAGFNVILRATNHALDMGYEGLQSELSYWKTSHPEVAVIGAQDPDDPTTSLDDVYVFEKDGFKVALLNYTFDLNGIPDPKGAVSMLEESHVRATLEKAEELADMTVVFPHWGEEYMLEPVEDQKTMAETLMECGADVIIGGHPHVVEPVEILTAPDGHKVPCFWSVGNFISTQPDDQNLVGGVAKVSMVKAADGTCSVTGCSFVPTITHKGLGTDMTTYLLRDYTDDLAASNYLDSNGTYNQTLTVAWANEFCTQVFGSTFDTTSEQIVFGPEAFEGTTASSGTQSTTSATSGTATETTAGEEDDDNIVGLADAA